MKIRDSKGYAMLMANVAQFGDRNVEVRNGSKKIFEGAASEFVTRYAKHYEWTLCAHVLDNETPVIVF